MDRCLCPNGNVNYAFFLWGLPMTDWLNVFTYMPKCGETVSSGTIRAARKQMVQMRMRPCPNHKQQYRWPMLVCWWSNNRRKQWKAGRWGQRIRRLRNILMMWQLIIEGPHLLITPYVTMRMYTLGTNVLAAKEMDATMLPMMATGRQPNLLTNPDTNRPDWIKIKWFGFQTIKKRCNMWHYL